MASTPSTAVRVAVNPPPVLRQRSCATRRNETTNERHGRARVLFPDIYVPDTPPQTLQRNSHALSCTHTPVVGDHGQPLSVPETPFMHGRSTTRFQDVSSNVSLRLSLFHEQLSPASRSSPYSVKTTPMMTPVTTPTTRRSSAKRRFDGSSIFAGHATVSCRNEHVRPLGPSGLSRPVFSPEAPAMKRVCTSDTNEYGLNFFEDWSFVSGISIEEMR